MSARVLHYHPGRQHTPTNFNTMENTLRKHIKKTTKRALLTSSLVGVATVGVLASGGFAYAKTGGQDGMAEAIASKFNLKQSEVQQVMNGQHEKRHQQRLAQLVTDGKLTQTQADKLKAKLEELKPKREAAHKETDASKRRAAHEAIRTELDQWAKDNGIDLSVLRPTNGLRDSAVPRGSSRQMPHHHDSE